MMRFLLSLAAGVLMLSAHAQPRTIDYSAYAGKYESNGFVIQIVVKDQQLFLAVPGAPLQPLIAVEKNKFKSAAFDDEYFLFVEDNGKITRMISQGKTHSAEFPKTSDIPDDFNGDDPMLSATRKTEHFLFLYSADDSLNVNIIAGYLEKDYDRILRDFALTSIPVTTVRIYPTGESFHRGINFPNAPPNILATAFGKDDFRMISPRLVNSTDRAELPRHVVHEFTHCVHLNISYSPNNPRWLWEGVAMYESGWFVDPKTIDVIRNKQYPAFAALNNGLEYELGYVIIEAIKEIWGFDVVVELIKNKGDVSAVLKIDQKEFEKRVYQYVSERYVR
jgi:hypothetical protein